ncbi:putative ABC transporter permease [Patescibacteria group bacterium]|jgi:uncharacterized membrane protein|nr:putative ABC transporter permease [Patescibacteria group bacterium]
MNVTRLIFVFFIASFLGWIIDSLGRSILDRKWSRGGFSVLPICPVYGFGTILLILFAPFFRAYALPITFLMLTVMLAALEYVAGVFSERVFGKKLWNYRKWKWDLHGRIELFHALVWGILGTLVVELGYPQIEPWLW